MKQAKRLLALLLVMAMVMVNVPAPVFAVGTTNVDGYIEVRTIEDLYNIRNDLAANYILMNDIDLTTATASGGAWDFNGNGWNPIGSGDVYGSSAFSGEFDGNGRKIIGMRIVASALPAGTGNSIYLGLFANISGYVHDLTFVSGQIKSSPAKITYAGALAGTIANGRVENVENNMPIDVGYSSGGAYFVGGISGKGTSGQVTNCRNTGAISSKTNTGSKNVGGILGYANNMEIAHCFNTGNVTAEAIAQSTSYDICASGIAGADTTTTISYCYNTGEIAAENKWSSSTSYDSAEEAGGISANDGELVQCYNVGMVVKDSYNRYAVGNGTQTNSYYLSGSGKNTTGATSLTEEQMLLSSMYAGFDFEEVWVQNIDAVYPYPQLKSNVQDLRVITGLEMVSLPNKTVYDYGEALDLSGCRVKVLTQGGEEEVLVTEDMVTGYDNSVSGVQTLTVTYLRQTVTFTVTVNEKVYIPIYTIEDLYNIRNDMDANYILMNDIDMTEATAVGGDWDFMGNGWNPIGSNDVYGANAFSGEFDGNGHEIIGMRMEINTLPSGVGSYLYVGMFAKISGSVHDLTFSRGTISCNKLKTMYVGTLAGYSSGSIWNVHSCASVSGGGNHSGKTNYNCYIAGIVGVNSESGTINVCSNTGSVVGAPTYTYYSGSISGTTYESVVHAGGICGVNSGMIQKCYNSGVVDRYSYDGYFGDYYMGGITGVNSGALKECYNTSSGGTYTLGGGIAQQSEGTLTECYNIGNTTTGIATLLTGGKIVNCYYLYGTSATGATSLTETQMRLQTMFVGFDFENTWILNEYANHPYPQLKSNVQDLNESASLVSIISWPLKQEYYTGDELVLDGCMIDVTYVSGHKELLSVTDDMISGFDNTMAGEQTVTVTYRGGMDTFPVTILARPVVAAVEVISQPNKTEFGVGSAFDFTGAKILVTYEGGATETLDVTEAMTTGGNIHHLGKQTITVSYYGQKDTLEVTVMPVSISSLKLEAMPTKLTYLEGQELDLTGMVLLTVMNTGTETQVNSGYTVSGYIGEPGVQTITIGYMGKTVSFEVIVNAKSVVEMVLKAAPKKTEYVAGQTFDPTGMMIVATYDNGETAVVEDFEISGFNAVPGLKTVVASYGGKYVAFPITVIARVVTDFKITSYPAKLQYLQYDVFDPTGLEVKATYNDGVTEVITDYELVGFSSNPGTHTVSVAYEGWVETFEVTVSPRELTNLVVVAPTKLTYFLSEEFDPTGMTVTARYNNGQQVQVDDYVLSGFDSNEPGTKTITVSYGGLTSAFSVSVSERSEIETNGSFVVDNLVGRLGEEVRVPVTVTSNTGIAGLRHEISFEASNLKLVGVEMKGDYEKGTLIVNDEKTDEGKVTIVWFCGYDVKSNGAVYELVFEVKETAVDGITEVKLDFAENDNGNISGENVIFGNQDGSVEVRSYWLGDLNGDRLYKIVDLVMLAQYVAGCEMELTAKQLLSADVNEDTFIDIHDVILLNQWLLEKDA